MLLNLSEDELSYSLDELRLNNFTFDDVSVSTLDGVMALEIALAISVV